MLQTELILDRLEPLRLALPTLLPAARGRALDALGTLNTGPDEYPKLYADSFTATLRAAIGDEPIEGWEIRGASNCLHLRDVETHLSLRFLKEFAYEGDVPPAGRNQARTTAWIQEPLLDVETAGGHPLGDVSLILVWRERDGLFDCTVYRPQDAGGFPKGARARAVMRIPVNTGLDGLSFDTSGSDEEHIVPRRNIIIKETDREPVAS